MNKVKCAICGKELIQITASHLKLHNMTRTEYINKFGLNGVQNTIFFSGKKNNSERVISDYIYEQVMKCSSK